MPVWPPSSSLSSPYCPRCGAANCRSAGVRDHFACLQCGAQFQLEQRQGQTVLRMQPTASAPDWSRLRSHLRWLLPALAVVSAGPACGARPRAAMAPVLRHSRAVAAKAPAAKRQEVRVNAWVEDMTP